MMTTSCGETSEKVAAAFHAVVFGLYVVMAWWHLTSTFTHLRRDQE